METSLRLAYSREEVDHLARAVGRIGTAGPRVVCPRVRCAALELLLDAREESFHVAQRPIETTLLIERAREVSVRTRDVRHEQPALPGLSLGEIPHFRQWQIRL